MPRLAGTLCAARTRDPLKFLVTTDAAPYEVDLSIGMCTCPVGNTGGRCKHQIACAEINLTFSPQIYRGTADQKQLLAYVAHGQSVEKDFFMNLEEFANSPSTDPTMVIEICEDKMELEVSAPKFSSADQPRVIEICDTEEEPEVSTPKFSSADLPRVIEICDTEKEPEVSTPKFSSAQPASEDGEGSGDIEELNKILADVSERICKFYCKEMMPIARRFANRAKNIKTTSACISFLASSGESLGLGKTRRSKINVQPTAVSRRKADPSRGRAPCLKGRITKKRAHSLSANVASNLPNAKLH